MSTTKTAISEPVPVSNGTKQATIASHNLLPHAAQYTLRGSLPNTPLAVSVISAILGGSAAVSLALAVSPALKPFGANEWQWARPQLGVYLAALGMFHLLEFWTTAGWNTQKLSVDGESAPPFNGCISLMGT